MANLMMGDGATTGSRGYGFARTLLMDSRFFFMPHCLFEVLFLFLLVGKVGLIYNGIAKRLVLVPDTRNQLPAQKSQPDYRGKFNRTE